MSRLLFHFGLFALLTASVLLGTHFYAQSQRPSAEAEAVLLLPLTPPPRNGCGCCCFNDDIVSTHCQLIQSQLIREQAIRKHELNKLPCLRDCNSIHDALSTAIRAKPIKDKNYPVLRVGVFGLPSQGALAILEAVMEAYCEHVNGVYVDMRDLRDEKLRNEVVAIRNELQKTISTQGDTVAMPRLEVVQLVTRLTQSEKVLAPMPDYRFQVRVITKPHIVK
jgi:hypothetical protein